MATSPGQPIQLTCAPSIENYRVSPATYLAQHPGIDRLVVGALIFLTPSSIPQDGQVESQPSASSSKTQNPTDQANTTSSATMPPSQTSESRLLIVQRSANDSMPGKWEVPGGCCDAGDITILHSVAREIHEETGLNVSRIVREIGSSTRFETGNPRGKRPLKQWLRLSFEVEVAEIPCSIHVPSTADRKNEGGTLPSKPTALALGVAEQKEITKSKTPTPQETIDGINKRLNKNPWPSYDIPLRLDPKEHQNYVWVTRDEILRISKDPGNEFFTGRAQTDIMLEGFKLRREAETSSEAET